MEHCVVFSVLPGKTQAAREFMRQLAEVRHGEHEQAEHRIGIDAERWFLAGSCERELLVGMIDTADLRRMIGLLAVSLHPYDLWFKARFHEVTGTDLNDAPPIDAAVLLTSSRAEPKPDRRVHAAAARGGRQLMRG
jgi:hypothetical protein